MSNNRHQQKRMVLEAYGYIPWRPSDKANDGWVDPTTMVRYCDTDSAFEALSIHELVLAVRNRQK